MVTNGGALAVSMMEAAVRAAVQAGAPRRTVAATAAAVASAMATRQNSDGECGAATEPSAESQRRKKRYQKKKDRRKAAKENKLSCGAEEAVQLPAVAVTPAPATNDITQSSNFVDSQIAVAVIPAPANKYMALTSSCIDAEITSVITTLMDSIERWDINSEEVDGFLTTISAMPSDECADLIKGMRDLREGTSPLRYRHISDMCNLLIAQEQFTREPGEFKALDLQKKLACWKSAFARWANDGRRP